MVDVNPKLTSTKLRKSAKKTSEGKGAAPLPGVTTDAKAAAHADPNDPASPYYGSTHHDPDGYRKNRQLAKRISKAVEKIKASDEHGPRFVLAWRMYPNKDHPVWQQKDVHYCGCGCGCSAPGPYEPSEKPARKPSKPRKAGKRSNKAPR
ncbi:MAG TPA: hypothetical protein VHA77_00825 [Xanthobacteraceae bacterium]|jgi:hypothetical protein|nr:hypothetical protein [Xanthobacteraceae bacterium]